MQKIIEQLLVLQERDRQILRVTQELAHISPERDNYRARATVTQDLLTAAKNRIKQIETERKHLDLEIETKKTQIEKYANQQLQTRKNEEYKMFAKEIDTTKAEISKIEDAEIELMEKAETAQKELAHATAEAAAAKKIVEEKIGQLDQREENFKKELTGLLAGRAEASAAVDESTRSQYERIFKSKGEHVVVNVEHTSCGGCHMKLPAQTMTHCRAQEQIVTCPSCGRILYFTSDMDLTPGE
jgi:predicted  nucleic acid-binding Zn-ribbon protein